ncbi:8662_t:CDS:1, partial [Acaulospora morrowiae]
EPMMPLSEDLKKIAEKESKDVNNKRQEEIEKSTYNEMIIKKEKANKHLNKIITNNSSKTIKEETNSNKAQAAKDNKKDNNEYKLQLILRNIKER